MQLAMRIVIGIAGVIGLLIAARLWMAPEEMAAQLGLAPQGPLGFATIRADMGGFFAAGGAFALAAAIKGRGALLLPSVVLIALALMGRLITAAINGFTPDMAPPLLIEAVLLLLFAAGWRLIRR